MKFFTIKNVLPKTTLGNIHCVRGKHQLPKPNRDQNRTETQGPGQTRCRGGTAPVVSVSARVHTPQAQIGSSCSRPAGNAAGPESPSIWPGEPVHIQGPGRWDEIHLWVGPVGSPPPISPLIVTMGTRGVTVRSKRVGVCKLQTLLASLLPFKS